MARPSCAAGAQNLVEHRGPRARPVSPIPGSPTSSAARASPPPLPGSPGEGVRRVDPGALRATICNYRLTSKRNVQSLATNVWLDTAPIGVAGQGSLTCLRLSRSQSATAALRRHLPSLSRKYGHSPQRSERGNATPVHRCSPRLAPVSRIARQTLMSTPYSASSKRGVAANRKASHLGACPAGPLADRYMFPHTGGKRLPSPSRS